MSGDPHRTNAVVGWSRAQWPRRANKPAAAPRTLAGCQLPSNAMGNEVQRQDTESRASRSTREEGVGLQVRRASRRSRQGLWAFNPWAFHGPRRRASRKARPDLKHRVRYPLCAWRASMCRSCAVRARVPVLRGVPACPGVLTRFLHNSARLCGKRASRLRFCGCGKSGSSPAPASK